MEINQTRFIAILLILIGINSLFKIILGSTGEEKSKQYNIFDVGDGIVGFLIIIAVLI